MEAAGKEIHAAKAKFYPSLNLTLLGGAINSDISQAFKSESLLGVVAPALSLPIFDGGRRRANLAGKDAAYDLAVADYNQTVVQALREVADQVDALRSLDGQLQAQAEARDTAAAAHQLAQQRYDAGIGGLLDVLSAEQQLLQTQQRMATLESQQLLASVKLRRALGGGFTNDAAQAADAPVSTDSPSS